MSKEAMKLALEALENHPGNYKLSKAECAEYRAVEDAIREALAEQPAQHPKAKAIAECLAVLRPAVKGRFPHEQALEELVGYIAAPQPAQQEPVAWRTFDGEGGYEYRTYEMNESYADEWNKRNPKHKGWVEPLYTSPPTQRTWVGLTDDEILYCVELENPKAIAEEVEAKLKEKNT